MFQWRAGYKHYNRLIDISFWILMFAYIRGLLRLSGIPSIYLLEAWKPLNFVLGVVFIFVQLGLIVLILMRRLRDEYAEGLWQKSAASFVKLLPVFPLVWVVGFFFIGDLGGGLDWLRANPKEMFLPDHALFPNPTGSIGVHQFEGVNFTIIKTTGYFPLIFAGLYKLHRWRDER